MRPVRSREHDTDGTSRATPTSGLRAESVRRSNLASVLHDVRVNGPLSRSDLVRRSGLTRSAVGSLIGELERFGLVTDAGPSRIGQPGRPSSTAAIDSSRVAALAVEIGVDEIAVAVVGLAGTILDVARRRRARGTEPIDMTVRDVVDLARSVGLESGSVGERRLAGIGVAVPGLVRSRDGVVVTAPNLDWQDVAISELLATALGEDLAVRVGNEADLGALAEARFGAGVGFENIVFVSGEVGVGGGLIFKGDRFEGRSGFAGEIGHLAINPNGRECGCGAIGCWETEVGERALLRRAALDTEGGADAVAQLLGDAAAGDKAMLGAIADHGRWVARGVGGLINVFDPDVVVLGGLFSQLWPFVDDVVLAELERSQLGGRPRDVSVVPARLGVSTRLVGAGELAFESLLDDPACVAESI